MSSQQTCESKVTDAETIRAVYPRHTMKRLALLLNVPLDTARHWLYRSLSGARRRELALALLAELDRQEHSRAAIRQQLQQMAGDDALASPGDGLATDETRRAQDRTKTR